MNTPVARRLGAAAVLAATALLGSTISTLGDPATACAKPKAPGFNKDGYEACLSQADDRFKRGEIGVREHALLYKVCCYENGGVIGKHRDGWYGCIDPGDAVDDSPAELPQAPGPVEATQPTPTPTPPPPTAPMATLPNMPPVQTR